MKPRDRQPIDWQRLKQRLAATEKALARGSEPRDADGRAVLRTRAQALASRPSAAAHARDGVEWVEFELAQRRFAVEAAFVREVQPLKELTGVPCTPPFVSGMINAHGRILAVIDLKKFFELSHSGLSDLNKVIILQQGDAEFGVLADRIVGTNRMSLAGLQPASSSHGGRRTHCLRGVTPQQVVLIDGLQLLHDPALVIDEEVAP